MGEQVEREGGGDHRQVAVESQQVDEAGGDTGRSTSPARSRRISRSSSAAAPVDRNGGSDGPRKSRTTSCSAQRTIPSRCVIAATRSRPTRWISVRRQVAADRADEAAQVDDGEALAVEVLQQTGVGYLVHRGRVEQLEGIEATPLDLVEHGRQQKPSLPMPAVGSTVSASSESVIASTDGHRHCCAPTDARRAPQRIEDRRHPSVSDRAAAHADSTRSSRDVAGVAQPLGDGDDELQQGERADVAVER